jgi:hypothetical protein
MAATNFIPDIYRIKEPWQNPYTLFYGGLLLAALALIIFPEVVFGKPKRRR